MSEEAKVQVGRRARSELRLIKVEIVLALVLALPNSDKLFKVECDASSKGISIVLSQEDRPIEYMSEKLNEA